MGGRTSGTRPKGNGAGWGGAAKGRGHTFDAASGAEFGKMGAGIAKGEGKRRKVAELLEDLGARERIAERWMAIIEDPSHPHHATMLDKGATRLDGAPTQTLQGTDGGPIVVVTGVPRAE